MPIIALLATDVDDTEGQVCVLSDIDDVPHEILSFIQSKVSTFKLKHSKMAEKKYFVNTCPNCGVCWLGSIIAIKE